MSSSLSTFLCKLTLRTIPIAINNVRSDVIPQLKNGKGTTGRLIEEVTNLSVHKFLAGHLGGDQQLCAQIEHNQIDLVIFLREAENPLAHEPDSDNICKLCDMYNIPLATNLATAELLVKSLERGDMEWREIYQ